MAAAPEARPSTTASGVDIAGDGIVWRESLAVVEGVTPDGHPQLTLRSYFRHPVTLERVWDEPPSGASAVDFATLEQRQAALRQMQELQATLDLIPPDPSSLPETNTSNTKNKQGRNGRKQSQQSGNNTNNNQGGWLSRLKRRGDPPTLQDESKDLNLQRAIARSMADQQRKGKRRTTSSSKTNSATNHNDDPRILYDSEYSERRTSASTSRTDENDVEDDDDLAMAKALSLSTAANTSTPSGTPAMTEDEMLKWAIEQSQQQGVQAVPPSSTTTTTTPERKVASAPVTTTTKPSSSAASSPAHSPTHTATTPTTASNSPAVVDTFDPYSRHHLPSSSSLAAASDEKPPEEPSIQKLSLEPDQKTPAAARRLSRNIMIGSRKRMESKAGVL